MAEDEYGFYSGTYSSLDPEYGELFSGYRVPLSEIGAPTSIQTANQIQEVTNLLNQGGKTIELQPISEGVFDQIPKQHFKEINRLTKLTGSETTVHAPMIDPAGFSQQGWSEENREESERQLQAVMEKSYQLNPQGNVPVTIHASAIPGSVYGPDKNGKPEIKRLVVMNQETKQITGLEKEEKYYPETGKVVHTPMEELKLINNTEWINAITNLAFYKKEADEIIVPAYAEVAELLAKENPTKEDMQKHAGAFENLQRADLFLENVTSSFRSLYNKAYKYGDDETKKQLEGVRKEWEEKSEQMHKEKNMVNMIITKSNLIDNTLQLIRNIRTPPQTYVPIENFAKDKSADTLGSVAFKTYNKYKEHAPFVSVENLFPGMAFSRAEDLRDLVEKAREKFVEEARKKGMSEGAAKSAAEKQIGVTWDVGHLNMMRKAGFGEKEIIAESEKIAPFVRHVHITDNFGFSDAHLPPGMGNVPTKEILKELEKKGFSGKKIIEAGGFVQHFKKAPTEYVLEAFGSPIYGMPGRVPYWNQISATMGNYSTGFGTMLPDQHFSMYGAGFSNLPVELGGQVQSGKSRLTGTPME